MAIDKIAHWSHPKHPLEKINDQHGYTCNGCQLDGIGPRYRCIKCNFDLHPDCVFTCTEKVIQGQRCLFYQTPRQGVHCKRVGCKKCRCCDLCAKTVKGFVYHCPETDWDFHPTCAKLKSKISIEDVTFSLEKQDSPSTCAWCNREDLKGAVKKIPGWSYVSNKDDGYNFHVYCMMEMALRSSSSKEVCTGKNMSLGMEGAQLPLQTKSKHCKGLKILKLFLGTVFSILLGDVTTILASTLAHLVVEGFFPGGYY